MSRLLLLLAMLGFAFAPFPHEAASASCAAPYIEASDAQLGRAATQSVQGRAFTEGACDDSQACSINALGCSSCASDEPPTVPMENVRLRLRQGDRTWDLAAADAGSAGENQLGWVTWTFELPAGVHEGPATLLADHAEPVEVRIG